MPRHPLLLLGLLLPLATVTGQSTWPGAPANTIGIRIAKSIVTADNGPDLATFTAVPSGRFALSPRLTLEVEIPIARASEDGGFGEGNVSGTAIGNPYVGIEIPMAAGFLQAGVRLGIAPNADEQGELAAQLYAVLSEFDRYEGHLPKTSAARVLAVYGRMPESGQFAQLRIGATGVKASEGDFEVFADYGGRIGLRGGGAMMHIGLLGRAILTSEEGSFGERTIHMLTGGVAATSGSVRPLAELRYFLDEGFDDARLVVALGAVVGL